jgi:hypothetical protein
MTMRMRIAAIWAISVWPALNFIASNWSGVRRGGLESIAGVLGISVGIAVLGHVLYRVFLRWRKTDIVVFWVPAVALFFSYNAVRETTLTVFKKLDIPLHPGFAWLLLASLVLAAAWRWRKREGMTLAAATFACAAAIIATQMLIASALRAPATAATRSHPAPAKEVAGGGARVNVYYLILDAYGGAYSLGTALGFDNSAFLARMGAHGFREVSSESSNYLQTSQTLSGIFSLDYPQTEDPRTWQDAYTVYNATLEGADPPQLLAELQAQGYATWFSATYIGGCPLRHVRCLGNSSRVDSAYMTQTFLESTLLGRAARRLNLARRDALAPVGANLGRLTAGGRPFFVFAHHLAPHAPYFTDRHCELRSVWPQLWQKQSDEKAGYLESVECVNRKAEQLVDRILAVDRSALIVLQSDHGSGLFMDWDAPMTSWDQKAVRDRASFLNLVRAPAECQRWLDRRLGQINTARFVAACVSGRAPDYLPEKTYLSSYTLGPEPNAVREWRATEHNGSAPVALQDAKVSAESR